MILKVLSGKKVKGKLTTKHPASRHGQPVLVVKGVAYWAADVLEWELVKATTTEREALQKAGYSSLLQVKVITHPGKRD